jgi:cytoskeleton protein RodZ
MDVGAALRDARERRSLSLDQLSQATKISVAILRAIENNEVDKLPGGIFTRGFLRAYAREVGLDPEGTVRRYLAEFGQGTDIVEVDRPGTSETGAEPARAVAGETDLEEVERRAVRFQSLMAAVALVISLVGYFAFARWRAPVALTAGPDTRSTGAIEIARSSSPVPSPAAATAARPETGTTGSRELARAVATGGDVLHVDIRPQGPCWLSTTADGTRVIYRLMQRGERQVIDVHDEVVLRVGDPAVFTFSINGMSGRPVGHAGEAVTVRITKQNYREFLSQ